MCHHPRLYFLRCRNVSQYSWLENALMLSVQMMLSFGAEIGYKKLQFQAKCGCFPFSDRIPSAVMDRQSTLDLSFEEKVALF